VEVKEEQITHVRSRMNPEKVVDIPLSAAALSTELPDRNKPIPIEIVIATTYSYFLYFFLEIIQPIIMTGMILEAFAKTWVGKLINLRASYWHQLLIILEKAQYEYLYSGAL
jgi:hypothetical protein